MVRYCFKIRQHLSMSPIFKSSGIPSTAPISTRFMEGLISWTPPNGASPFLHRYAAAWLVSISLYSTSRGSADGISASERERPNPEAVLSLSIFMILSYSSNLSALLSISISFIPAKTALSDLSCNPTRKSGRHCRS